ncbi:hypothetical protein AB0910_14665 [Streptomyces sp. NPDC047002]|uniref:hypothetical protein n=1 Tax=Streptomyces sp. NPDC047002 TaxID=3155475 RepID=UPI0034553D8E
MSSSVRPAVASALAAPLLLLTASAVPAAAQGGTAEDGTYYVKEAATGRCLAGARLATCGSEGTVWTVRNHGDGTVQFLQAGTERRCLALPATTAYPAAVRMDACDAAPGAPASPATPVTLPAPVGTPTASASPAAAPSPSAAPGAPTAAGPSQAGASASPSQAGASAAADPADRWRIEGWADGPATIAHAYPPAGRLAVQGSVVRVSNNSSAMWVLEPVRK